MHSNIHHTINATEQAARRDAHTLWYTHFRKLFALLFLMLASVGARAADYVIQSNDYYMAVDADNNLVGQTNFDPNTCIWRSDATSGGSGTIMNVGSNRYLQYNNGLTITNDQNSATTFYFPATQGQIGLCLTRTWRLWTGYSYSDYLVCNNGTWTANGSANANTFTLTTNNITEDNSLTVQITPANHTFPTVGSTQQYYVTVSGTYRPAYTNYSFAWNDHHIINNTDIGNADPTWHSDWGNCSIAYQWSLSGDGGANATISNPTSQQPTVRYATPVNTNTNLNVNVQLRLTNNSNNINQTFPVDYSVNATLVGAAVQYPINIANPIGGTITATPSSAEEGDQISISASPSTGYQFGSWIVNTAGGANVPVASETSNPTTFTMPASEVNVSANFIAQRFQVNLDNNMEHGTVDLSDNTAITGSTVTLTPRPDMGYTLNEWNVRTSGGQTVAVTNNSFTMPASDVVVSATFSVANYTITVSPTIQNGSVTTDHETATMGTTVTLTATPNANYMFSAWDVRDASDRQISVTDNQFTMPASNVTVSATFTAIPYHITIANNIAHGSISSSASTATAGTTITLSATPDAIYILDSWSITNAAGTDIKSQINFQQDDNSATFTMPGYDVNVSATFEVNNTTVEISEGNYSLKEQLNAGLLLEYDIAINTTVGWTGVYANSTSTIIPAINEALVRNFLGISGTNNLGALYTNNQISYFAINNTTKETVRLNDKNVSGTLGYWYDTYGDYTNTDYKVYIDYMNNQFKFGTDNGNPANGTNYTAIIGFIRRGADINVAANRAVLVFHFHLQSEAVPAANNVSASSEEKFIETQIIPSTSNIKQGTSQAFSIAYGSLYQYVEYDNVTGINKYTFPHYGDVYYKQKTVNDQNIWERFEKLEDVPGVRITTTTYLPTSYNWTYNETTYSSMTSSGSSAEVTYGTPNYTADENAVLSCTPVYSGVTNANGENQTFNSPNAVTANITLKKAYHNPLSLTVSPSEMLLEIGRSEVITCTLTPDGALRDLSFTSSDSEIVAVDANGVVKGKSMGTAVITVVAHNLNGTDAFTETVTVTVKDKVATPTFSRDGSKIAISCATDGATIYYTTNGTDPTSSSDQYTSSVTLNPGATLKAIALKDGWIESDVAQTTSGTGTSADSPYMIYSDADLAYVKTHLSGYFKVGADFSVSNAENLEINNFSGVFDGDFHTISGLSRALFDNVNGGTVKNVRLKNVNISSGTDVGALANTATNAKIYNCGVLSGSVSGTRYVGGLVGAVSGSTKVINNYNYASIISGQSVAGIVGYVSTNYYKFKHNDVNRYLTEYNGALQIRDNNNGGYPTYQYWILEPSGTGYKLRNYGRNPDGYIATSGMEATFNTTGDVYTLVNNNGKYRIQRGDGRYFGTDATTNGSKVYTNKQGNQIDDWILSLAGTTGVIISNCVNYATEVSGTNKYPVYGGDDLDNKTNPLYDFFLYDGASYRENIASTNGALPAEARFLNRFEYVRATLNAEKKLAAYYLFGTQTKSDHDQIGKWVLDKEIAPYPIIKPWGKYPSLVNPDVSDRTIGILSVTISNNGSTRTISLPISDQLEEEFDYGYHKVQLPYYNDYFNDNYKANSVVTGWKITNVSGGTEGSFTKTGNNAYNFADRDCTQKDLFSVSGRIFAQGGYYYVPEGVTGITIEPYWANDVVYLHDPNIDKVFGMGYTETNYGPTYQPTFNVPTGAKVRNSLRDAHDALTASTNVYDHAIVLIGNVNFRYNGAPLDNTDTKGYTIMSIDEDHDNEPDYAEIYGHVDRRPVPPTRLDFVHQVGISWVKKPMGETLQSYSGIPLTRGRFEITETAFARFTEFETGTHVNKGPLIFNAGLIDQFVTNRDSDNPNIDYAILGGHTYFSAYTPGCHPNSTRKTTFWPVSVMGGEYAEFYLTGMKSEVVVEAQNGRVYTNGGKMGTFAGAYWEQLNGDAIIRFDHTWVNEFFGGGINPAKPITGNIDIIINNCDVDFFCAGPKAGNMTQGKTVTTIANNDRFGTYVGAGYGGSSVARFQMHEQVNNIEYINQKTNYFNSFSSNYLKYVNQRGILVRYAVEYMPGSGGMGGSENPTHVTRFYNDYAQLNLAQTYSVTSTLNGCTVKQNFYGGPYSGTVGTSAQPMSVTSSLSNCIVNGNVYGGGKSATIPDIIVYPNDINSLKTPLYNGNFGVYYQEGEDKFPVYPEGEAYTWKQVTTLSNNPSGTDNGKKYLETTVDLNSLGSVFGNTNLTVTNSTVDGYVFGGGDASKVTQYTKVIVDNSEVKKDVFGGGFGAPVGTNTAVWIKGENCFIHGSVLGGGFGGDVSGDTHVQIGEGANGDLYPESHLSGRN